MVVMHRVGDPPKLMIARTKFDAAIFDLDGV